MTAASCTRCESPLEAEDLRCAVCALPVPAPPTPRVAEETTQILRCHGCGAGVRYRADIGAPRCDFCGSVMALEIPDDPVEQADHFLRFAVTEQQARAALRGWLGGLGFFRPSDLAARSAVDALKPLWWAGWMFSAEGTMCWAADSEAGSRRSAWAPHSGRSPLTAANIVVPASRGLSSDECRRLVRHYDLSNVASKPEGHPKATVEQFVVQRSAARRRILEALEHVAITQAIPQIPGSKHRNVHVSVLPTRLTSQHFAFPAYVLAYRYGDRVYRAVVHGQDARCVLAEAPWSWAKIIGTGLAIVAVIAIIATIIITVGAVS